MVGLGDTEDARAWFWHVPDSTPLNQRLGFMRELWGSILPGDVRS